METNQTPDPASGEIAAYHDEIAQIQQEGYEEGIRKARNSLYWAGGLIFFWEIVGLIRLGGFDGFVFAFATIIAGIFIALAFWTKKKPYTAIILGIIAFVAHWLIVIAINGMVDGGEGFLKGIMGGIIIRIVILINLIRPLKDAKELQEMMAQKK